MTSGTSTLEERVARRAVRRSQVRRRRTVALAVVLGLAALVAGVVASSGDDSPRQAATPEPATPTKPRPVPAVATADPLGSGRPVTLAFGGDIHFESPIREQLARSPASVLGPIASMLEEADLSVVNLETAVTSGGSPAAKEYTFRAPASAFDALRLGGVDVANLANNHGMDFGTSGLRDTLTAARRAGVPVIGAGSDGRRAYEPYRATLKGQRIAVIGATQVLDDHLISAWSAGPGDPGLASAKNEPRLVQAVRQARRTSDTVVVFLHWGTELESCPTGVQRSLARTLAAAGADVIVGSHAHVLSGAGTLGKAFVAYGLGNLVFYASRELTSRSGVVEVTVTGRRIDGYRFRPARISGGIPYPLTGAERDEAIRSWRALRSCTGLRG